MGAFEFDDASLTAETLMQATTCLLPRNLTEKDFSEPNVVLDKVERLANFLLRALRGVGN